MQTQTLSAEVRAGRGKGPARQLRAEGKIPAVFYGRGTEGKTLALVPRDLLKVLSTELGRNALIELTVDGKKEHVMVKDVQLHPVSKQPLHADLYKVELDKPVAVRIPFKAVGRAVGMVKGGKLKVVHRDVPALAKPGQIPAVILVDVSHLDLNEAVQVKDLQLPEGVTVTMAATRSLALVEMEKIVKEEEVAPGAPGAAPAAGATPSVAPAAAAGAKPAAAAKPAKK